LFLALPLLLAPARAQMRLVALSTNDLVADRFTQRLYASVPSRAGGPPRSGGPGNSVTAIDPLSGKIGPSIFVGSEPGKMALSDGGRSPAGRRGGGRAAVGIVTLSAPAPAGGAIVLLASANPDIAAAPPGDRGRRHRGFPHHHTAGDGSDRRQLLGTANGMTRTATLRVLPRREDERCG
jgi:hypothetical protein